MHPRKLLRIVDYKSVTGVELRISIVALEVEGIRGAGPKRSRFTKLEPSTASLTLSLSKDLEAFGLLGRPENGAWGASTDDV